MNRPLILIPILSALLAACQSASPPPPGKAALCLCVCCQPKTGVRTAPHHVSVYDSNTDSGYAVPSSGSEYEKVDYTALSDIVVWLQPLDKPIDTSGLSPGPVIDLDPRKPAQGLTRAVCVGQPIVFRNLGDKPADVYSVSDGNEFDLGSLAPGASAAYIVKQSGLIEVLTSDLADPIANVYAAPSPWFALTRAGQTIEFNDLPPGPYKIVSWHPRLPGHETTAILQPDHVATASIMVSVNGLPPAQP